MHGQTTLTVILTAFSWQQCFTRTRLPVTSYVDGLSCSSSVYRRTVTQIPVQTSAVRYQSRHSDERRKYQVHSPELFRRTTHLRPIYFLALPCTKHSPSYRVLGAEHNSSDGVARQMEAFCAIHLSCSGTHCNRHSIYLCYPSWFQEARSHLNLGAMLHLNGKFMEAAISYREALRLQPDDVTTLTNLHKLYNLLGKRGTTWHHTVNDTAPPD